MDTKNNISELLKKLLNLLITILGLLAAIIGALFALLKKIDWQGLFSTIKREAKSFDKEKAVNFLKNHKKAILIGAIVFFIILMIAENLLCKPTDFGTNTYSGNTGYSGYSSLELCYKCKGGRYCVICDGMGYTSNYGFKAECTGCHGDKFCSRCKGTGFE